VVVVVDIVVIVVDGSVAAGGGGGGVKMSFRNTVSQSVPRETTRRRKAGE